MGIREWPGFLKKTEDFEEEVVRLCTYVHAKSIIAPLVSDGPLLTHRHTNRTMREASCKSVQKKTEKKLSHPGCGNDALHSGGHWIMYAGR